MDEERPDRRRFLQLATCAIGGGVGIVAAAPVIRLVIAPAGLQTVTSPTDALDIGADTSIKAGAAPRRLDVIAPVVQDAWSAAHDVVLGSAWVRRTQDGKLSAFSAVCPHLGCAIGFDAGENNFLCPCHKSRFGLDGERVKGPTERGMDPLPFEVKDGRIRITWVRYRVGGSTREKV
jgi:menaquinol-cytochrome c reductase iron-sulfur subunit